MGTRTHSLLSASSSERWLACPPSARLCERFADSGSSYAAEGTDAHALAEYKVKKSLGLDAEDPRERLSSFTPEMDEHTDGYAQFVMEQVVKTREVCSSPLVLVEQRVNFSRWVPNGYGTADCLVVADGLLHVVDFKYGAGVPVSAKENAQLSLYALGALEMFGRLYDIGDVTLSVYQPRRENVSTYTVSVKELLSWAENVLAPAAKLAFEGKGEFNAGEHCRFCKAKAACRKRAEFNLELARYDFEMPPTLTDEEVASVLAKADELAAWAGDLKDYALQKALSGTKFDGFKLVEGRSVRRYTDEDAVAEAVGKAGYDPYEKKVRGITAMSAYLGKKQFKKLLEDAGLVEKPRGKPTLVPMSDKRPAIDTAAQDFRDE